jgi:alkyl hydroperoxide reductase subunit AhpC
VIKEAGMKNPDEHASLRGFSVINKNGEVIESNQIDPFGINIKNIITYASGKVRN